MINSLGHENHAHASKSFSNATIFFLQCSCELFD